MKSQKHEFRSDLQLVQNKRLLLIFLKKDTKRKQAVFTLQTRVSIASGQELR